MRAQRTFCVEGHHYALVVLSDLDEGSRAAVRGASRRRARLAARRRPAAVDDPHARARAPRPPRLRLVPRRRSGAPAVHARAAREHPARLRHRRALGALAPAPVRAGGVARLPAPAGRPGLRRRDVRADARLHPRASRHEPPAGRAGRRLRGVRAALPRGLERSRHPLAARDRAEHDDLRRPRRPRRLEHLRRLGARDAGDGLVGRAHHRRVHVVLDLPAHRQPGPAGAGGGAPARGDLRRRPTAARACASSRAPSTASPRRAASRSIATSAARGSS